MSTNRRLVLDANILIRAVLGSRVRELIANHAHEVSFFAPEAAYDEAREHLPAILRKRGVEPAVALAVLDGLLAFVQPVAWAQYRAFQKEALGRIGARDPDDWPAMACALWLNCPVWTEDADFFGSGVATWTTDRVHLFLM